MVLYAGGVPPHIPWMGPISNNKERNKMTKSTKAAPKATAKKVVAVNEFKKEWEEFVTEGKDAALALAKFTSASAVATMATSSLVLDAGTTGAKLVTVGSRKARAALKEMDLDQAIASMF